MAKFRLDSIEMPDGNDYEIPVFIAEYGVTPYSAIEAVFNDGKLLFCVRYERIFYYSSQGEDGEFYFIHVDNSGKVNMVFCRASGEWSSSVNSPYAYVESGPAPSIQNRYLATYQKTSENWDKWVLRQSGIQFGSSTTQYLANNGTWQNVPSVPSAATATPSDLGTAAVGSSAKYAKEDHVHNKPTYSANDVGAIAAPSSPTVGDFLVYTSNGWAAQSLSTWQGGNY